MKILSILALAVAASACTEHVVDLIGKVPGTGDESSDQVDDTAVETADEATAYPDLEPVMDVSGCTPTESGFKMERVCFLNADGPIQYDFESSELATLSPAPPYALYVDYSKGYAPVPENVSTEGPQASIKVYAALCVLPGGSLSSVASDSKLGSSRDSADGTVCFPEDSQKNRVRAHIDYPQEGGLLIVIDEPLAIGSQVVVDINEGKLRPDYLADEPATSCTDAKTCVGVSHGYTARFFVRAEP